jgi:hypothetical protein
MSTIPRTFTFISQLLQLGTHGWHPKALTDYSPTGDNLLPRTRQDRSAALIAPHDVFIVGHQLIEYFTLVG